MIDKLFHIWVWLGLKVFRWEYVDIYSPDKDEVIAVTFSHDEEYIDKIQEA